MLRANMSLLNFRSLPIWSGTTSKYGQFSSAPFSLVTNQFGLMCQSADEQIATAVSRYSQDTYEFITPPPGSSSWADQVGEQYVRFVDENLPVRSELSVLEIGAGSDYLGTQLCAHNPGITRYVVVDPAVRSSSNSSVITIRDYFPSKRLDDEMFDFVVCLNTIEHVQNPQFFLSEIRARLKKDGLVFLVLPDVAQQMTRRDFNMFLHEHISYFTEKSLTDLAKLTGFSIESINSSCDTLYCILSRKEASPICDNLMEYKTIDSVGSGGGEWSFGTDELKKEIAQKRKVGFYGATNGLNNFIFLTGLVGDLNIFVFDGDESKVDRFIPTIPNPIRGGHDASIREMDLIFVSAMSFFDPIREHLLQYHQIGPEKLRPLLASREP